MIGAKGTTCAILLQVLPSLYLATRFGVIGRSFQRCMQSSTVIIVELVTGDDLQLYFGASGGSRP